MKNIKCFLVSLFLLILPVYGDEINIAGENVILYNLNDQTVLYSKNENDLTKIASLTKIMTALVTIENTPDLNKEITFTDQDFVGTIGYSKAGFKVGDTATFEDLLYAILLPSGADAVNAAVNNTLGYEEFIKKMNDLAQEIGMNDTNFSNPIGKDDELNYSTASDVAKMLIYALKNKTFKKVFTTKEYTTTNKLVLKSTINSYEDILDTNIITGAKSGFTKEAGRCLASITNLHDTNYLLVVINSSTDKPFNAIKDSLDIYAYFDEFYGYQEVLTDDTFIKEIPISLSSSKTYKITGNETIRIYLRKDTSITYTYEGIEQIPYKTKKGTKLGTVKIYDGNNLLKESDVYLEENINYYPIDICVIILMFLIIIIVLIKKLRKKRRRRRK